MSHVTDVILLDSGYNKASLFYKVNDYLIEKHNSELANVENHAGGNKAMQCDVYVGAFNHMDIEAFMKHLSSIRWDKREAIQVLIKDEHDEWFMLRGI